MGVKRADDRRRNDLRVDVGVKEGFKKKLVRSGLKWAGLVKKWEMKNCQSADAQKVDIKRRRGRPIKRMRWEDCVKRDLESVGGEWRTTAKDRRILRMLIKNSVRERLGEAREYEEKMTVTVTSLTADDRDNKRRTTTFVILSLLCISGGLYGRSHEISRWEAAHLCRWSTEGEVRLGPTCVRLRGRRHVRERLRGYTYRYMLAS